MWVKLNFKSMLGIGSKSQPLHKLTKFAIEVNGADAALAVANTLSNNPKCFDVKVVLNKPTDTDCVYIRKDGITESESQHLITNNDLSSFVWTIKAGMQMYRALVA